MHALTNSGRVLGQLLLVASEEFGCSITFQASQQAFQREIRKQIAMEMEQALLEKKMSPGKRASPNHKSLG